MKTTEVPMGSDYSVSVQRRCLGWGGLAGNLELSNAAQGSWLETRSQGRLPSNIRSQGGD